jgi:hypothetical protein
MTDKIPRRTVLLRGLQTHAAAALLLALTGCTGGNSSGSVAAGGTVCADPNAMDDSEQSTRKGVGYTERSPDPKQVCGGCSFFHGGEAGSMCGTCDVLSGKPVNPHGHCNSWSAKG